MFCPPRKLGGIFFISVITYVTELEIQGFKVRLTKYKLMIYEEDKKEVTQEDATVIAQYLWEEGFIKKDDFPVEIISYED